MILYRSQITWDIGGEPFRTSRERQHAHSGLNLNDRMGDWEEDARIHLRLARTNAKMMASPSPVLIEYFRVSTGAPEPRPVPFLMAQVFTRIIGNGA